MSRPRSRRHTRLRAAAILLGALLATHAATRVLPRYRFALNQTDSLPHWAFLVDQAERRPARGDLIAFVAPTSPFVPAGTVFGKIVGGVPGDLVARRGRTVYVNGHAIGAAKPRARDGRRVTPGPVGRIPPGRYFVYAPSPDSLDSRYAAIGWIAQGRILGRAWPVL